MLIATRRSFGLGPLRPPKPQLSTFAASDAPSVRIMLDRLESNQEIGAPRPCHACAGRRGSRSPVLCRAVRALLGAPGRHAFAERVPVSTPRFETMNGTTR